MYLCFNEENVKIKKTRLSIPNILLSLYLILTSIIIISTFTNTISANAETYSFVNKWGSHGDTNGRFEEPTGIAIGSSNDVYVSDMDFENCCNPLHHTLQNLPMMGVLLQNGAEMAHSLILWESL